jgi:hypothetical protein
VRDRVIPISPQPELKPNQLAILQHWRASRSKKALKRAPALEVVIMFVSAKLASPFNPCLLHFIATQLCERARHAKVIPENNESRAM